MAYIMRHALVVSNWWSSILVDATPDRPNLDDPRNMATIERLARRYDVFVIVSPHWHSVGTEIRDCLRAAASRQQRPITLLRYVGSLSLRWGDQPGAMSVVPVASAVTSAGVVRRPAWTLKTASRVPIKSVVMGGISYLLDPSNSEVVSLAKKHLLLLATGWDGIFIDEVGPTYHRFQLDSSQVDPRFPIAADGSSPAYETARRAFLKEVTGHLAANGKKVGVNIDPKTTMEGFFPATLVADSPGLLHPFVEVFGTSWEGQVVGASSGDYPVTVKTMDWLATCGSLRRSPIVNAYTRDPAALRYALALFLASAGPEAVFSGNRPSSNSEYSSEPVWVPEFAAAATLGAPVGVATGTAVVRRAYDGGCVLANVTPSSTTVELGGAFRAPTETADTTRRTLGPTSGALLTGQSFGSCASSSTTTQGALKLVGGRWCAPRTTKTASEGTN